MKKTDWQYLVDTLLFLCIVGIVIIGIFMGFFIPKGPAASESSKYFLGLHRHQWGNIHLYLSLTFSALVIIHIVLAWKWIKGKTGQLFKKKWKFILALTVIVSFAVLSLFWLLYPKEPGAYEDYGKARGKGTRQLRLTEEGYFTPNEEILGNEGGNYLTLTGKMTLRDVEKITGIPAGKIVAELRLPSGVSFDETLGRLRKKYPFTLQQARDIISELLINKEALAEERKKSSMIKKEEKLDEMHNEEHEEKITRGKLAQDKSGILITGRMTLYDVEDDTGISALRIADKLGLPADVPLDETLGRLRKRYFFTMQEVRDAISYLFKQK